jgi:hypothetical protein
MAMRLFTERTGAMMVAMGSGDDGDDLLPVRRYKRPSGLRDVRRVREIQNENIEEHAREPRRAKITETEPHHHLESREDKHGSVRALALTKKRLPVKKWLAFVGMEFGMVEDAKGILRVHRALLRADAEDRDLSFEEVAAHYGLAVETVKEYDRDARREYRKAHEEVETHPKESYWWGDERGPMGKKN